MQSCLDIASRSFTLRVSWPHGLTACLNQGTGSQDELTYPFFQKLYRFCMILMLTQGAQPFQKRDKFTAFTIAVIVVAQQQAAARTTDVEVTRCKNC